MVMRSRLLSQCGLALVAAASLGGVALATDAVDGSATLFTSYNGVGERCVRIAPLPGAEYDKDDLEDEAALCAVDLYDLDIALCPKIWSTSPSIVLYDLTGSEFEGDRLGFQTEICAGGKLAEHVADGEIARLKFTMNQEATSAAFVPAPLLYYHLSRYLGTEVLVPVAVWRSVDAQVLRNEVGLSGASLTENVPYATQIHAAWDWIVRTIDDPSVYDNEDGYGTATDLLTADGSQAYGVLLDATDKTMGPALNGLEIAFWDEALHRAFFMSTGPFRALMTDLPLAEAILEGRKLAQPPLAETMPEGVTDFQMVIWMRELSEIVLLDHILAQQDRAGNIDRKAYYYWVKDGEVARKKAKGRSPGDGEVPAYAEPILHAVLNDNDAAGRVEYHNQARLAGMLASLRHFDAGVYTRLQALAEDLAAEGPAWGWLNASLGLERGQVDMIRANTLEAAGILHESCSKGALRFDLDPAGFYMSGTVTPAAIDCGAAPGTATEVGVPQP